MLLVSNVYPYEICICKFTSVLVVRCMLHVVAIVVGVGVGISLVAFVVPLFVIVVFLLVNRNACVQSYECLICGA